MDTYTFVVENFYILDTRALHNDTLYLYYTAYVDHDLVASHLIKLGDFDNGEYSTVDYVPSDQSPGVVVVINDPGADVAFNFQLVNAGNPPGGSIPARLASTAQSIFSSAVGLQGVGVTQVIAALDGSGSLIGLAEAAGLMQVFSTLWSWLTANCDGPVAVDQISGPRFALDAWTDNPAKALRANKKDYPGLDSPAGCGGNSHYQVDWSLQHSRTWVSVSDPTNNLFNSEVGLNASTHHGAAHAFGVLTGGTVTRARTFTGATWYIDTVGTFNLEMMPVSSISFDDRLYVFAVQTGGSIACLAYTVDGTTWTPHTAAPPSFQTNQPVALAVFLDRLYMVARVAGSNALQLTSTSDLRIWTPWTSIPAAPAIASSPPVAAAALDGKLFLFEVVKTGKRPDVLVMRNWTTDGVTWNGWEAVEAGLAPEDGSPSDYALDVSAGTFEGRVYIASRWQATPPDPEHLGQYYLVLNFSKDGDDWSGWRIPQSDAELIPPNSAGLAAVNHHLYLFAANLAGSTGGIWAY
jgi:hypothetical protein